MLMTIEQIKEVANASEQSKFYFKPATMRWWRTRVSSKVYPTKHGAIFVQSDDPGHRIEYWNGKGEFHHGASRRLYTIKTCADSGTIRTVGSFGDHTTLKAAHRAASAHAKAVREVQGVDG